MGRTIPSWRMVVENELPKLEKFRDFLRAEDKEIYDDLLNQCRLYASYAGSMASPVKEIPLIISMLFGQHKRLVNLEKQINETTKPRDIYERRIDEAKSVTVTLPRRLETFGPELSDEP